MVIYNKYIPFRGYKCINLFGLLFVRNGAIMSETDLRHEMIHSKQCLELLGIGFYIIYVIEWVVRLFIERNMHKAYRKISFEQEAYSHEKDTNYQRKIYAMWRR